MKIDEKSLEAFQSIILSLFKKIIEISSKFAQLLITMTLSQFKSLINMLILLITHKDSRRSILSIIIIISLRKLLQKLKKSWIRNKEKEELPRFLKIDLFFPINTNFNKPIKSINTIQNQRHLKIQEKLLSLKPKNDKYDINTNLFQGILKKYIDTYFLNKTEFSM